MDVVQMLVLRYRPVSLMQNCIAVWWSTYIPVGQWQHACTRMLQYCNSVFIWNQQILLFVERVVHSRALMGAQYVLPSSEKNFSVK